MSIDYFQLLACVALVGFALGYFGGWALEAFSSWMQHRKERQTEWGYPMHGMEQYAPMRYRPIEQTGFPEPDEWIDCTLLSDTRRQEFNPYRNEWRSTPFPTIDSSLLPLPKED